MVTRRSQLFEIGQRATAAVTIAAALWRGFTFGDGNNGFAETLSAHVWVLVWVSAIGLLVGRSLSVRRLVGFTLTGFFLIPILVKVAHGPLTRWAGEGTNWASAGVVPVLEEVLKALPLVVVVIAMRRDRTRSLSVLDFGLAGFALGAGFAIHEDLLWERTLVGGFDGVAGLLAPSFVVDPLLVVGHAGWTALIGLGIGIAVVHRGRGPAWLAAVLCTALAIGDHAAANYRGDVDVRAWVLDGRLAVAALAVGLVGAIISGLSVQRWATERDRVFPPVPLSQRLAPSALLFPSAEYARERSMAHTGAWRRFAPGHEAVADPHVPILLYDGATRAGLVVVPSAASGTPHPERSDRRRTHPLVVGATIVVLMGIAAAAWSSGTGDDEVADASSRGQGSDRSRPDPVEDSDRQSPGGTADGDGEKDKEADPAGSDATLDLDAMTVVWVKEEDGVRSTMVAARDADRQIVRSDDLVIYRDADGGHYCVLAGENWSCGESAGDPWSVGAVLASFLPDPSMAQTGGDGMVRIEVFADEIDGRAASCYRQEVGEEVQEMCVDVATRIVLRQESSGEDGTFSAAGVSLTAIEVRDPRPSDFELPPDLDIDQARS